MKCDNKSCCYDLWQNALGLSVELQTARLGGPRLSIFCPVCGAPLAEQFDLQRLGLCRRERAPHVRWKDGPQQAGPFRFSDAQPLSADEICFSQVPMLRGVTPDDQRRTQVPDLPVRPEYLDLLDMPRYHKDADEYRGRIDQERGRYVAMLPLRGRVDPVRIERPLVNVRWEKTLRTTDDPIEQALVCVWPKVRNSRWKSFIVDVELPDSPLGEPQVHVRLHKGAQADREENAESPVAGTYRVLPLEFQGYVDKPKLPKRFAALFKGARPELVCVSWPKDDSACGGTFVAARPLELTPLQDDILELGVDFGTSSSCVAFKWGEGQPTVPPIADTYEYLVRPWEGHTRVEAAAYHPRLTRRPFGARRDLLPSELLLRTPLGDPAEAAMHLRPGLDHCIPGDDVAWGAANPAPRHVIKDLKWGESALTRACRVTYLKTLLMQTLAAAMSAEEQGLNPRTPSRINVKWGFPGVWRAEEVASLRVSFVKALNAERSPVQAAGWAVSDWTEAAISLQDKPEAEAFAVSHLEVPLRGHDAPEITYRARVIVDVGGGSTDIAFLWIPIGKGIPHIIEYMTSIKYAGNALFDGLEGSTPSSNCFAEGNARTAERRLRAEGPLREYFAPDREKARSARITLYVQQLMEYVARLVASSVLSGSVFRRNPALQRGNLALPIQVVRLGNGLGLASLMYDNLDESLRARTQKRIDELTSPVGLRSKVDVFAVPGCNPKHAVALGLLSDHKTIEKARYVAASADTPDGLHEALVDTVPPWTFRTILGLGFTTRHGDEDKRIEWWREVSSLSKDGTHFPKEWGHGPISLAPYMTPHWLGEKPSSFVPDFPPDVVGVDEDDFLKTLRLSDQQVQACIPDRGPWFKESPLERLLQTSLKDRLKRVMG